MTDKQILNDQLAWLETELKTNQYAEIGITLIVHGGEIVKVKKDLIIKLKPQV